MTGQPQGQSMYPPAPARPQPSQQPAYHPPASSAAPPPPAVPAGTAVLDRKGLEELAADVDPSEVLDEDVKDALLQLADDLIDRIVTDATRVAKHRKSATLEASDVQFALR